jgi:putative exosortase-associated protein (TIGR04073 family)
MRLTILMSVPLAAVLVAGCAGPEQKLGRGLSNLTEFARMGELRRSMEQTALWEGPEAAYTTGFVRGFNRSIVRTALGAYEIVTFPIPPYHALLTSTNVVFPDYSVATLSYPYGGLVLPERPGFPTNYRPGILADSTFATDTYFGFGGGDVAPMVPGSRFHVFDN